MTPPRQSKLKGLREKLAAIEHERWADWQKWVHSKLIPIEDDEDYYLIPSDEIERWASQILRPYDKLTDKEKASDMEQVDRYWPLITTYMLDSFLELIGEDEDGDFYWGRKNTSREARNELRNQLRQAAQEKYGA